ncbi:uncharacterized protein LOC135461735 isoform X2 [Liolophura sinensis]|uniref:uncharacterized protein LOC135461735 isoform X2 n=1 Tax=Liolophura sinensis TaxID=3198878 RepID=UPI0031589536
MSTGKRSGKHKVAIVSANLEVVSQEKFNKRLEGLSSSCANCQRERAKSKPGNNKQKRRRKQAKANTPIVIKLKDTLKAAIQQKYPSLPFPSGDCPSSERQKHKSSRALWDIKSQESKFSEEMSVHTNGARLHTPHHHHFEKHWSKDEKNFASFLSVIEKAHQKDSNGVLDWNLDLESQSKYSNLVLHRDMVLNNEKYSDLYKRGKESSKRRSIVNCENVDLICNDLTNLSDPGTESTEDSEVELSSVLSSSEHQSDSELSVGGESSSFELSKDELERLAEYTTGFPLIRYDCAPSECPQCLAAAYSAQYYADQDSIVEFDSRRRHSGQKGPVSVSLADCETAASSSRGSDSECEDDSNAQAQLALSHLTGEDSGDEDISLPYTAGSALSVSKSSGVAKLEKQLCDIDVIGWKRSAGQKSEDQPLNSVYIDLTDTDVTFTVYYHHKLPIGKQSSTSACTELYAHYISPLAMLSSSSYPAHVCYHPYYTMPFPAIPSPLYLPPDNSVPKLLMVPPSELQNFTATTPPQRQWIPLAHPERNKPTAFFTVMCYNVLCDKYCTRQLYGYCPSWALNWEYRKKGILEEIKNYSADIISLQEVETDQFYNFFLPELKHDGYDGIFSPKSRARTMTEHERKHVDGCAIFFRTSKFSLLKDHLIEFNQLAMANAEGSDEMLNRVMTKDNIGLAALLETKEAVYENGAPTEAQLRQPILVATAHIHWDPEFSDVKLIQTMMLMWELKNIIEDARGTVSTSQPISVNSTPLILCGDLNSLPDSGVVEYLTSSKVPFNHMDFKDMGYESCLQKLNFTDNKEALTHDFRLARAYDNDIMPHTNYTFDFKGLIDYIFYSRDFMNCLGVLGPLEEDWFKDNKILGCPHPHVPSDHFPLFVELEMPLPTSGANRPSTNNHSKLR